MQRGHEDIFKWSTHLSLLDLRTVVISLGWTWQLSILLPTCSSLYLILYPSSINNLSRAKITSHILAAYDFQPCLPHSVFFSQPCSVSSVSSLPFIYRTPSYMPTTSKMSGNGKHSSLQPFGRNIKKKAPLIYHVFLECPQPFHVAGACILVWRAWSKVTRLSNEGVAQSDV